MLAEIYIYVYINICALFLTVGIQNPCVPSVSRRQLGSKPEE